MEWGGNFGFVFRTHTHKTQRQSDVFTVDISLPAPGDVSACFEMSPSFLCI